MEPLKIETKQALEHNIINRCLAATEAIRRSDWFAARMIVQDIEAFVHRLPVLFCEHLIYCRELRRPNGDTGPGLVCLLKHIECPRNVKDVASCGFLNPEPETVNCEPGTCKI